MAGTDRGGASPSAEDALWLACGRSRAAGYLYDWMEEAVCNMVSIMDGLEQADACRNVAESVRNKVLAYVTALRDMGAATARLSGSI